MSSSNNDCHHRRWSSLSRGSSHSIASSSGKDCNDWAKNAPPRRRWSSLSGRSRRRGSTLPLRKRLSLLQVTSGRKSVHRATSLATTTASSTLDDDSSRHQVPTKSAMKVKTLSDSLDRKYGAAKKKKPKKQMSFRRKGSSRRFDQSVRTDLIKAKSVGASLGRSESNLVQIDEDADADVADQENKAPQAQVNPAEEEDTAQEDFRRSSMMRMKMKSTGHNSSTSASNLSMRRLFSSARKLTGSSSMSLRDLFARQGSSKRQATVVAPELTVRFDTVEIRGYQSVVSDNPETLQGPGVTLGWAYGTELRCPLDIYEQSRGPFRMDMHELTLTQHERRRRLLENGVTVEELMAAQKRVKIAQQKRERSINSRTSGLEERMEGAGRKFKKMIGAKKSQEQEEEKLWSNAQIYFAAY